jgi:hypothetical protein
MKKIVNFTPTGTQPTRINSFAPLTPSEIVDEVIGANEVGISIVHLHARDEVTLENTYKKEVYQKIIEGIKKYCPELLICVSLTGRNFPELSQRAEVLQLYPDMGSLTMSSLNFPSGTSVNQPEMILSLINEMDKYGVQPEIECFDTGMLNYTNYLISKNILKSPHHINIILGNIYNGQCEFGKCICKPGWKGSDCSIPTCPGSFCYVDSLTRKVHCNECSSNGVCTTLTTILNSPSISSSCKCNDGWTGNDCSMIACGKNCMQNNNNKCLIDFPINQCICQPPTLSGINCDIQLCLNNCSNSGICNSNGTCDCSQNFYGDDCSVYMPTANGVSKYGSALLAFVATLILLNI